jgi:hypothetical protein
MHLLGRRFEMKLIKVEPLIDAGNIRALVKVETPTGETITCRIVKQEGFRAYLVPPEGITFTHKDKRHLQREAVTAWADMVNGTLEGMLLSEKVFKCGSRFHRLGVQLKVFCPVCQRNTPAEFSPTSNGGFLNSCYYCGTRRKGRPYVSREYVERHKEKLEACQGIRGIHDRENS